MLSQKIGALCGLFDSLRDEAGEIHMSAGAALHMGFVLHRCAEDTKALERAAVAPAFLFIPDNVVRLPPRRRDITAPPAGDGAA